VVLFTFIASMVFAVYLSVSPFVRLEAFVWIFTISALMRFAASSNEVRVLVDGSKKKRTTVWPRSVGTFFIGLCDISLKVSAVWRISSISSVERLSRSKRSFLFPDTANFLLLFRYHHFICSVGLLDLDLDRLFLRGGDILSRVIRPYRKRKDL